MWAWLLLTYSYERVNKHELNILKVQITLILLRQKRLKIKLWTKP